MFKKSTPQEFKCITELPLNKGRCRISKEVNRGILGGRLTPNGTYALKVGVQTLELLDSAFITVWSSEERG